MAAAEVLHRGRWGTFVSIADEADEEISQIWAKEGPIGSKNPASWGFAGLKMATYRS